MREQKYIANIKRLQSLITREFSIARQLLTNAGGDNRANLESIISALQWQDIVYQRIQHLIDGFESSKAFFHNKRFKHAFLDLQYFQLITIASDLEKTIAALRTLATSLKNDQAFESAMLFPRYNNIRHLFNASQRTSLRYLAQRILSGSNPFSSDQAAACLRLYTMQSERIVFQWFLASMPFGNGNDLLRVYDQKMNAGNESIELF